MSRHRFHVCAAVCGLFVMLGISGRALVARQQGKPGPQPAGAEKKKEAAPAADRPAVKRMTEREIEEAVDREIEKCDLKPHGLPAVPDNPPPHEGAMINYSPYVIEPPDLVLIEVLEALPGRPISGERLVRPDGKISLGFYGEVHVAGLTLDQAKVAIIKHIRSYLSDETLGIVDYKTEEEEGKGVKPAFPDDKAPMIPGPPDSGDTRLKLNEPKAPHEQVNKPKTAASSFPGDPRRRDPWGRALYGRSRPGGQYRLVTRRQEQDEKKHDEVKKEVDLPLKSGGKVTITIDVQAGEKKEGTPPPESDERSPFEAINPEGGVPIPCGAINPKDTNRVFLDVTAYNSVNYYVLGDVAAPGRLPFTGNETVLDALQYGGGLLSSAEDKDIHLVRPARGGKPAHVYKVDLEAIQNRGDSTTNYQIFPGDRLVVGRNDVVKKTIQLDRLAAPLQTATTAIRQEASMLQSIKNLSVQKQDALLKDLVDFWIQAMRQKDDVQFDENTLREALMKRLK